MKLEIELSEEQLNLIINALEINFRLMMKQAGIVADLLAICPNKNECGEHWETEFERYLTSRTAATFVLDALSRILYGDMYQPLPEETHKISDIWATLRHTQWELLKMKNPDSELYLTYDVRSRVLQQGGLPLPKITIVEADIKGGGNKCIKNS